MTDDDHTIPEPVPPEIAAQYSLESDPDSEADVARYVEGQTRDEVVQHVEKIKTEHVLGDSFDIWDVSTDKDRFWVISNLMNLYSQQHFPSLDYTLTFHVGLMARMRARSHRLDGAEPHPFDEVFRRQEQASERLDKAVEPEDYQAVGMLLRESLLSLISAMRRHAEYQVDGERPAEADFPAWVDLLMNAMCAGSANKQLRQFLKNMSKDTWRLVNWLTHDRDANQAAASIGCHSCDTVVGHFAQMLVRDRTDKIDQCPICHSRHVRSHYDPLIEPDGDYYSTCGECGWSNHPEAAE